MLRELSLQQQDPVDSAGATRLFAIGTAILTTGLAILMTVFERSQVWSWSIEVAAIALVAVTGVINIRASSPFRAPVRRRTYVLILSLCALCFVLDEWAQAGKNAVVHDDWGLVVITFYMFVLANVRPAKDILIGGLAISAFVGTVTFITSPFFSVSAVPAARVLVVLTSIIPAAIGGSFFALSTVRMVQRLAAVTHPRTVERESVRLSVQQENIAQLEAEVVPLIQEIVDSRSLTAAHGARARSLATSLRAALVADLDLDWLSESGFTVEDPDGYASRMSLEQRTTVRGLVAALPIDYHASPASIKIWGQDLNATFEMQIPLERRPVGPQLGAAVVMLRTVFPQAGYAMSPNRVRVHAEFSVA